MVHKLNFASNCFRSKTKSMSCCWLNINHLSNRSTCICPYLHASDPRWQHQPLVIAMHHHYDTNGSRRNSPRVLVGEPLFMRFGILKRDVEHLGEVLAQVMRSGSLWDDKILHSM